MTRPQRVSGRRVLNGIVGLPFGFPVPMPKRRGVVPGRTGRLVAAPSRAKGQGHGKRTYRPVKRTNRMTTTAEHMARRDALEERDAFHARQIAAIRKRLKARDGGH